MIGIGILIIVILPHIYLTLEDERIPFLFHVIGISKIVSEGQTFTATYDSTEDPSSTTILKKVLYREFLHVLRISAPYLGIFILFGIVVALRNFDLKMKILFGVIIISLIIAIPQYTLSAEYRNLLLITPFFCILSAVGIQILAHNIKLQNVFLILMIGVLLVISFYFIKEVYGIDDQLVMEKEKFGKFVTQSFSGKIMGDAYNEISHNVDNAKMGIRYEKGNIYNEQISLVVSPFPLDVEKNLLQIASSLKIDYIIIDAEEDNRYPIFREIFYNEQKYPFLEKIFDSYDEGYQKYHVKIFKIKSE